MIKTKTRPHRSFVKTAPEEWTTRAYIQTLRATKQLLEKRYQRKQPDPAKMRSDQLNEEWQLLWTLVGTTSMTRAMRERWQEVDAAHSSNAVWAFTGPY